MYGRDDVELALYALEEGMGTSGAAGLVGCGATTVRRWSRLRSVSLAESHLETHGLCVERGERWACDCEGAPLLSEQQQRPSLLVTAGRRYS